MAELVEAETREEIDALWDRYATDYAAKPAALKSFIAYLERQFDLEPDDTPLSTIFSMADMALREIERRVKDKQACAASGGG